MLSRALLYQEHTHSHTHTHTHKKNPSKNRDNQLVLNAYISLHFKEKVEHWFIHVSKCKQKACGTWYFFLGNMWQPSTFVDEQWLSLLGDSALLNKLFIKQTFY